MNLIEQAQLIGSCMDDGIIEPEAALQLLVERSGGRLHRIEALLMLVRRPLPAADDWTPLRDWDGGWPT